MRTDNVLVLTMGGTIDKVYFDALSRYSVGPPSAEGLLHQGRVGFAFRVHEICRKDSLEITSDDLSELCKVIEFAAERRILITHGTDTMYRTAALLADKTGGRTIALTGSMEPARFNGSDALFNLGLAVGVLAVGCPGVFIAMHGFVGQPGELTKNREAGAFVPGSS